MLDQGYLQCGNRLPSLASSKVGNLCAYYLFYTTLMKQDSFTLPISTGFTVPRISLSLAKPWSRTPWHLIQGLTKVLDSPLWGFDLGDQLGIVLKNLAD